MNQKKLILILKYACFFLLIGRGWQHFYWNAPYRVILWDEALLSPFINYLTPWTWQEYVSSDLVHSVTQFFIKFIGVLYFLLAFVTIFVKPWHKKLFRYYTFTSLHMIFLTYLITLDKGSYVGLFVEHAIQFMIPLLFAGVYFGKINIEKNINLFKIAAACTFIGHGLFAVGFHPVPGNFVEMIITTFQISETDAYTFLRIAGTLDFAAALLLFIPQTQLIALAFMSFWGIVTAFARTVAHLDLNLLFMSSTQWIHETLYRLPHGLVPLFLIIYLLVGRKSLKHNKAGKIPLQQ